MVNEYISHGKQSECVFVDAHRVGRREKNRRVRAEKRREDTRKEKG
jgi:hypothetical protein